MAMTEAQTTDITPACGPIRKPGIAAASMPSGIIAVLPRDMIPAAKAATGKGSPISRANPPQANAFHLPLLNPSDTVGDSI